MKGDPFFKDIDWKRLEARHMRPPLDLNLKTETEEEAYFSSMPPRQVNFTDQDYTEENRNVNRLKKYTFMGQRDE